MILPLSKTLDPADFEELVPELSLVDRHFTTEREQHPMRRWEYALALRALTTWRFESHRKETQVYDIGGAGSPFRHMVDVIVVDPDGDDRDEQYRLEDFVCPGTELASCVFCLSVLEHVDDLDEFLYHLSCLVAPGGLLFLSMDCREDDNRTGDYWPEDNRHFYWMRKRIFTPRLIGGCICDPLTYLGFSPLGGHDASYHGHTVYDYTFASLALVKRT